MPPTLVVTCGRLTTTLGAAVLPATSGWANRSAAVAASTVAPAEKSAIGGGVVGNAGMTGAGLSKSAVSIRVNGTGSMGAGAEGGPARTMAAVPSNDTSRSATAVVVRRRQCRLLVAGSFRRAGVGVMDGGCREPANSHAHHTRPHLARGVQRPLGRGRRRRYTPPVNARDPAPEPNVEEAVQRILRPQRPPIVARPPLWHEPHRAIVIVAAVVVAATANLPWLHAEDIVQDLVVTGRNGMADGALLGVIALATAWVV